MLRLRTFGGLSLEQDGQPITGAASQRRRLALLAILATGQGRGVTRDRVLALLGPERVTERGSHALAQALYALRRDLGADPLAESGADPPAESRDHQQRCAGAARSLAARGRRACGGYSDRPDRKS